MKKTVTILLIICMLLGLTACGSSRGTVKFDSNGKAIISDGSESEKEAEVKPEGIGMHHIEIYVKNYGVIKVELNGDVAPITVENFMNLINEKFYDGLTFHRIINGFMMQGGDPTGTGMSGSEKTIKGEFNSNGVTNNLSHTRGAISMARSSKKDSASSQFFIVHQDSTFLDGEYACFGYVTEGMDVVDAVCKDAIVEDNNGTVLAANQPVIEYIVVID